MNLQEQTNRIKEMMGIIEEHAQPKDIQVIESVLNSKLPKKFPWWKKINIQSLSYAVWGSDYVNIYGVLTIDSEWAHNTWKERYKLVPFPEEKNLELPELLTDSEYSALSKQILKYHNAIVGDETNGVYLFSLDIRLENQID